MNEIEITNAWRRIVGGTGTSFDIELVKSAMTYSKETKALVKELRERDREMLDLLKTTLIAAWLQSREGKYTVTLCRKQEPDETRVELLLGGVIEKVGNEIFFWNLLGKDSEEGVRNIRSHIEKTHREMNTGLGELRWRRLWLSLQADPQI